MTTLRFGSLLLQSVLPRALTSSRSRGAQRRGTSRWTPYAPPVVHVSGAIDARAFNKDLNEWEQRFDAGQIPWKREAITVDGTPIPFDVLSITDRWIAVGRTNVVDVLVQGQGSPFDGIALDSIQEVDPPDPPRRPPSPGHD